MTTIYTTAEKLASLPERNGFDFYPTPLEVAADALSFVPLVEQPMMILDPGAGTGVWGQAARQRYGPASFIKGVEIREDATPHEAYDAWVKSDYLNMLSFGGYDLIVGNPPYKHAEQFVRKSFGHLKKGGVLVFLLRLAFLEGLQRGQNLFAYYPPQMVVVRSRRVSFTGNGKSNATAYAYFIWQQGWKGQTSISWTLAK
jgi:hypothetical protein